MNIDIDSLKSITKHKIIYPVILLGIVAVGTIIGIIILGNTLYAKYQTLQTNKSEVSQMRARVVLVRNNKEIFTDKLDEYNELLNQLIPDEESYFSVVSALETLASKTGVTITSYTINLQSTTEEKLTLSLNISGEADALNKLLSEYMFMSGRLITNDKAIIGSTGEKRSITISFNLFHKGFKDAVSPGSVVTQQDLQFLDDIKSKL